MNEKKKQKPNHNSRWITVSPPVALQHRLEEYCIKSMGKYEESIRKGLLAFLFIERVTSGKLFVDNFISFLTRVVDAVIEREKKKKINEWKRFLESTEIQIRRWMPTALPRDHEGSKRIYVAVKANLDLLKHSLRKGNLKNVEEEKQLLAKQAKEEEKSTRKLKIETILVSHHGILTKKFIPDPLSLDDIAKDCGKSISTISRWLDDLYWPGFWKEYRKGCRSGTVRGILDKLSDGSYRVNGICVDSADSEE